MRKERKRYTGEEKVAILRRHLLDKVPVSDLCEEHRICHRRTSLLLPQIVFVIARIILKLSLFYLENAGGQLVDEIPIVRDEYDCPVQLPQRFEHHVLGLQVKVI